MDIQDVILFCSTASRACVPCIQFIQNYRVPVKIVRLDTVEARMAAINGKHFQIQNVPTLLVTHADGNLQLFAGQEKVIIWLQKAMDPPPSQVGGQDIPPDIPSTPLYESSDEEESKGLYGGRQKSKKLKSRKPSKPSKILRFPPKSSKKRRKSKKSKSVRFEEPEEDYEEVDIEFIEGDRPNRPPAPPTQGLIVGPQADHGNKRMSNILEMAKQMQQDRTSTLGYDEKELPKNG